MLREIYCRMPSDKNYIRGKIEIHDQIEYILQQIRVCLGTNPGDVLGAEDFGIDLNQYVFSMSFNQTEVKNKISELINQYVDYDRTKYVIDIDVNYGHDRYNACDYAVINISINQQKMLGVLVR